MLIKIRGKMTQEEGITYVKPLLQTTQLMCLRNRIYLVRTWHPRGKVGQSQWKELSVGWQGYAGYCRPGSNTEFITSAMKRHGEILRGWIHGEWSLRKSFLDINTQPAEELMLSNCGAGEKLLKVPWTARRPTQSILKEINPEYSLEKLMLKLKHQYFGHVMQRANLL